jgi:hypothetical protein
MTEEERRELAARLEQEIRPLIELPKTRGGYDCCGCRTYDDILDHAIRVVLGEAKP